MKPGVLSLSKIEELPRNAKNHDLGAIHQSYDRFSFIERLIINNTTGHLVAGHGRLHALKQRKQSGKEAPEGITVHGDDWLVPVDYVDISADKEEAAAIALNRSSELGGWDDQGLAEVLADLAADDLLDGTGFDGDDLDELLAGLGDGLLGGGEDPGAQVDKAEELREKWDTATGQLWRIPSKTADGEHRIICGDCTDAEVVARVMGGEKAEMMFTDPPYGVNYSGGIQFNGNGGAITSNRKKMENDEDAGIYARFLPVALPHIDGPCYAWFADDRGGKLVYDAIINNKCEIHAMIIWNKINATYAAMNAQYKQRHEPCMYFKPRKSTLRWIGPSDECTVWDEKRDGINEYHPTQKPVALPERALRNHAATIILDPFLGSGTTIVACEHLGRLGRGVEIAPSYVAVALERLAGMGLEPELVE